MRIGFIGCGNMGGALIRAIIKDLPAWHIAITDKDGEKASAFASETGVMQTDIEEIAGSCKYIFLAVKPQVLPSVAEILAPMLESRKDGFTVVSMAAGITTLRLKELLGDYPIIRIMPNLPVSVGGGMILYTSTPDVSSPDLEGFLTLMKESGKFIRLDEGLFDAGTSVSGCGPAFVCQFIQSLVSGGVECGLHYDDAIVMAEQTLLGTAKMLLETKGDPGALCKAVCSPSGSTIEGVKALEGSDFDGVVKGAVLASYRRNVELGK